MTIAFFDIQRVRRNPAVYETYLFELNTRLKEETDDAARASLYFLRGHLHSQMERYAEAEQDYLRMAEWLLSTEGANSPNYAGILLELADCWRITERYEKAQEALETVLGVLSHDRGDERYLRALLQRARLYKIQQEPERAQVLLQQLLAMAEAVPSTSRTLKMEAQIGLAILCGVDAPQEAIERLRANLALCGDEVEMLPFRLRIYYELAELYLRAGEGAEAVLANQRALELIQGEYAETSRPYLQLLVQQAHIDALLKDEETATRHYRQILERAFDKMGDGTFVVPGRAEDSDAEVK